MTTQLEVRLPGADQIDTYRKAGLWIDRLLSEELEAGLLRNPDTACRVWSKERPFSGDFRELHERARRLAAGMIQLGIGPGDVVSFQLPNWIEAVECFLATMFAGAVSLPIVHIYGRKELAFVLAESRAKLHVTVDAFRQLQYREVMDRLRGDLPALKYVVYIDDDDYARLRSADPLDAIVPLAPDAPAILGYTSGTTSDPKGVIHTHRTIVAEMIQKFHRAEGDTRPIPLDPPRGHNHWLVGSPIGHVSGLQTGILFPILLDRPSHLIDHWDIETVLDILVKADLSLGGAATFFFNSLVNHPKFRPEHVDRVRYLALGGAPIPRALGERCDALGIKSVRCYGSTEHPSVSGCAFDDPLEKRVGTDGRPLAGVEIEIRDAAGRAVAAGTPGEIHTRGPDLFAGYTDPRLNDAAFDEEGWFCTGDVGVLDADGYLTLLDRTKDIIIRGGENISAAEVEEALNEMPAIIEAAAVAAPDERMGEHVCAFIRVGGDSAPPTLAEMRQHLTAVGIARQKWPEELRVVEDFPRTPSGKIRKIDLRQLLRDESRPAANRRG
jgi:acyl-CoA synthetase (AMP-forming)/AMP-acid ligase II